MQEAPVCGPEPAPQRMRMLVCAVMGPLVAPKRLLLPSRSLFNPSFLRVNVAQIAGFTRPISSASRYAFNLIPGPVLASSLFCTVIRAISARSLLRSIHMLRAITPRPHRSGTCSTPRKTFANVYIIYPSRFGRPSPRSYSTDMPSSKSIPPAEPRPSASIAVINARNEVLLVQRNPKTRSFAGVHVC